ncbi:MAG: M48 family metallopeptidase [Isosphaeraceae bacterium]|nr:M48 family metallopeptidase [Isosphaeraceae bacterium]
MIRLPPTLIEYIVAHKLVHLLEPRHDAAFWNRLERVMPDYRERKQRLAETGSQY